MSLRSTSSRPERDAGIQKTNLEKPGDSRTTGRSGLRRILYYVPWTLVVLISVYVVWIIAIIFTPQTGRYAFNVGVFFGLLSMSYFLCILPPLIFYRLLEKSRRTLAYIIHALWFCIVTGILLVWKYKADIYSGHLVTPLDIYDIQYGLMWSSIAGIDGAPTWLIASGIVGVVYLAEVSWRRNRTAV